MERQFEIEERERDRMGYYAKTDRDTTRIRLGQSIATVEEVITDADSVKLRAWLSNCVTAAQIVPQVGSPKLQAWADQIGVSLDNAALAAIRELAEKFEKH